LRVDIALGENRVAVGDVGQGKGDDNRWVKLELELDVGEIDMSNTAAEAATVESVESGAENAPENAAE